ncbi:hypothetical protein M514_09180 [Trichuris suis]|uniref:Uncharacterized protein n=1 Tax=Trichuris suis TaxID=68888 RepID=A0A085MZS5_9BILA|nr:hypothetical protein M513_09180 [Trichuris suis]KFD62721.1 hypothetical protein M514_09180 [Trichuris suis]
MELVLSRLVIFYSVHITSYISGTGMIAAFDWQLLLILNCSMVEQRSVPVSNRALKNRKKESLLNEATAVYLHNEFQRNSEKYK